jgi:hypothetical protein
MLAYLNCHCLPRDEIAISPDDRGFIFREEKKVSGQTYISLLDKIIR